MITLEQKQFLVEVFDDYGNTLEQHGTDFQEVSVTVEFQNDPPVLPN